MCDVDFPRIQDVPQRTAGDVRRRFADVMREVRKGGVVAITHRNEIAAVIVDAKEYRRITTPLPVEANDPQRQTSFKELTDEFDRRLASLQKPDAGEKVDTMMDAQGKTKRRPKAGDF